MNVCPDTLLSVCRQLLCDAKDGPPPRHVVSAIEFGDAEVLIGPAAKFGARLQSFAPNSVSLGLELIDRLLPQSDDTRARKGRNIAIPRMVDRLSRNIDDAADRLNEV